MYIYKYSTFTYKDTYKHGHTHTHTYVHTQTYTDIHAHMYETYRIYYLLPKTMLYQNDLDNRHLMWIIWFVSKHVFQFLILLTYGMVVPILWLPKWWFCHCLFPSWFTRTSMTTITTFVWSTGLLDVWSLKQGTTLTNKSSLDWIFVISSCEAWLCFVLITRTFL